MIQRNILGVVFISAFVLASNAYAGKVDLTTYYPAPYGEYVDLQARAVYFQAPAANPVGLIAFNYGDTTYDGRLCITGGSQDPLATNAEGASLHLDGNNYNSGRVELVAGRGGYMRFFTSPAGVDRQERMRITADGKVGIGATPGYKLHIVGEGSTSATYGLVIRRSGNAINNLYIRDDGAGYLGAAAWSYSSDSRLKENIGYIQSGLNIIEQLKPVKFDYIKGEKKQAGFVAQEVREVLPDIVSEGPDGMLGMKTDSIIPYLVKAVQEQQKEIDGLKSELQTQIDLLKKEIAELKKQ